MNKSTELVRHAVLWIDHQHAEVVRLGDAKSAVQHLKAHEYPTQQHHSGVRSEHEFFGQVSDALECVEFVLVTGSHTALTDFRHYVEKHRPHVAPRTSAYQVVDRMTENQLRALGDAHFARPPNI